MRDLFPATHNDLIENPSPRCACMLVLDTSGSMDGAPIAELNEGLRLFIEEVQNDELAACSVEVGVITAGDYVSEVLPFTTAMQIQDVAPLQATGNTPLGGAIAHALQRLDERKAEYKRAGVAYYQPWLVVISDGAPTDGNVWVQAAANAKSLAQSRKLVSLAIGVQGADLSTLSQCSSRPAKALAGLKFREFFQWLSASMSRVSQSNSTAATVNLPQTDSWDSI